MPNLPLRKVGSMGVVTDVDPYSMPIEQLSFGKNIRLEQGKIERGGVFRSVGALVHDPRFVHGWFDSSSNNHVIYGSSDGNLYLWTGAGETTITPAGWTASVTTAPWTTATVDNLIYVNRPDHVPWYGSQDSTSTWSLIPTSTGGGGPNWDTTFRCQSLRTMNDMLVAFNITKGANTYPTMVKWSNFVSYNQTPPDWDVASVTSSAGESTLGHMKGHIVDGVLLKDRMMIYGDQEVWAMDYIGGNNIFAFSRLFNFGIMSQNCAVEVSNNNAALHYVFGANDIIKTDGIVPISIADGRVRRFIYDAMLKSQAWSFFVAHNPALNEVMFCYASSDAYCAFPANNNTIGCNRAAIYNYALDAWYFADLPYVFAADLIQPTAGAEWLNETTIGWTTFGGSWAAQAGNPQLNLAFISTVSGSITQSLRTFDRVEAATTTYPIDANANAGAYLERDGIALDEIQASLRAYKLVSSLYPECRLSAGAAPLVFNVGVSDHPNVAPTWGNTQTFDQNTFYKLDFNQAGRFLYWSLTQTDQQLFTFTGFDADVTVLGQR
jgi:hypothetical protein